MGFGLLVLLCVVLWFAFGRHGCANRAAVCATHPPVQSTGAGPSAGSPDAAETIARERFARGEISRDDYEQIVAALRK